MKMEIELNVVTLNCWGIKCVSKDRVCRMNAVGDELAKGRYDFVFLQEVWTNQDYERIKKKTAHVLPYSHYFYSGVIGSGLCIFSRSPIINAFFHQWAVNGYMHKIQHGDWFGGKGLGMVQVFHRGLRINLYTAHLHAEYDRVHDEYLAHRVTQAFDTAQFVALTSKKADLVIIGGDLNTEPGDLAYRVFVHTAELRDSFFDVLKLPGSDEQQYTCETSQNSYTPSSHLKSNPFGKRIDYVLYKPGECVKVNVLTCATSWPKRVPEKQFSYSDHEAVVVKLKVIKSSAVESPVNSVASRNEALEESIEICSQALQHLRTSKKYYIFFSILFSIALIASFAFNLPGAFSFVLTFIRGFMLLGTVYAIFMGIIWNRMEVHGILAGKLQMSIELGHYALFDPDEFNSSNTSVSFQDISGANRSSTTSTGNIDETSDISISNT